MVDKVHLYDEFGGLYDLMVCWENRLKNEAKFFQNTFRERGAKTVLDVACGTGMHAILFADWGYDVIGADLSEEMLRKANANAGKSRANLRFVRAGFGELGEKIGRKADVVTCLGNSLPHLLSADELSRAIHDIYSILNPGGLFITQNRNYDRVWHKKERFMPLEATTIDGKELLFFRLLDFYEDTIGFNIITFTKEKGNWSYTVNATRHRPVLKSELERTLLEAGFIDLQFLGDYQGAAFDVAESTDLIVIASKQ